MEKMNSNSNVKQVTLFNDSDSRKYVKVFSDDNEEGTGRIVHGDYGDFDEFFLIRVVHAGKLIDFLTRPFKMFGEDTNLARFFSPYQFQSTIIDVPIGGLCSKLNMEIPLESGEKFMVTIFKSNPEIVKNSKVDYLGGYIVKDNECYVKVVNKTNNPIQVDILYLAKGNISDEFKKCIDVDFRKFNVRENHQFESLTIWSNNSDYFSDRIILKINDDIERIVPYYYISNHQFQSILVNINKKFTINKDTQLITVIKPNSTIFFDFSNYPEFHRPTGEAKIYIPNSFK